MYVDMCIFNHFDILTEVLNYQLMISSNKCTDGELSINFHAQKKGNFISNNKLSYYCFILAKNSVLIDIN